MLQHLTEVTPVTTPVPMTRPQIIHSVQTRQEQSHMEEAAAVDNTSATVDNNTITFRKPSGGGLDEGTYSNCTITVTDE